MGEGVVFRGGGRGESLPAAGLGGGRAKGVQWACNGREGRRVCCVLCRKCAPWVCNACATGVQWVCNACAIVVQRVQRACNGCAMRVQWV